MSNRTDSSNKVDTALNLTGSLCSIVGLIAVIVLQRFDNDDRTLLFWWLATVVIGIAAVCAAMTPSSTVMRVIFVIVVVAQLPAFDVCWGELHERDTHFSLRFYRDDEQQKTIDRLEQENAGLKQVHRESLLFWEGIAHLVGIGFGLLACTTRGRAVTPT